MLAGSGSSRQVGEQEGVREHRRLGLSTGTQSEGMEAELKRRRRQDKCSEINSVWNTGAGLITTGETVKAGCSCSSYQTGTGVTAGASARL